MTTVFALEAVVLCQGLVSRTSRAINCCCKPASLTFNCSQSQQTVPLIQDMQVHAHQHIANIRAPFQPPVELTCGPHPSMPCSKTASIMVSTHSCGG
jgi:hypothetical protein